MTLGARRAGSFDAIVIGSGFGGSMIARSFVDAGLDVLMLERGDWVVRGPHNWHPDGTLDLTPYATSEPPYRVLAGGNSDSLVACSCIGGPSVFFGGVSLRFREGDFEQHAEIADGSGASWPYRYDDLEPHYTTVEAILDVSGDVASDPTEPFHSAPYPQPPDGLSDTSRMMEAAANELGLRPFRLPLAVNYRNGSGTGRSGCARCTTCDTFACAVGAKNDLATCVLSDLVGRGMRLEPNTVVTRLLHHKGAITGVECHHKQTGRVWYPRASTYVLSAGALGSPHVLLASGLDRVNPAGHMVGRHLMRHCNAIAFGIFPRRPNRRKQFHKQIGIHDFYFGHPSIDEPFGKLGSIQQLQTPPIALVRSALPRPLGPFVGPAIEHVTGLLVMAEDQPRLANGVAVDWSDRDRFGLPRLTIEHRYTARDRAACRALVRQAKKVLWRAGAPVTYVHRIKSFSHSVGTARFGADPATSVLDPFCGFRGIDNLYVVDASFMPTAAGVNPSLTISANALRVGEKIVHG
jgi:choline dehydrogenase-like flavoprotein